METRTIHIGMLGCGFMGKAHSHAYSTASHIFEALPLKPVLYAVSGSREDRLKAFAHRFGYRTWSVDWMAVIDDPKVEAVNVCLPEYLHKEACVRAIEAGKHVLCEKPLALSVEDCWDILLAAKQSDKKQMCGFNYRFLPAVRFARDIISKGLLKRIYHVSARYFQESGRDPNRPAEQVRYAYGKKQLGTVRGLGSHLIDTVRFLAGDISRVSGMLRTFHPERTTSWGEQHTVTADELAAMNVEFASGAVGALTASAVSTGRKNQMAFEVYGAGGSIGFDLEHPNYLDIYLDDSAPAELRGFSKVNVTDKSHPLMEGWWPPAHNLGWEHGHINQMRYFLECIAEDKPIGPVGATFEDGLKAAEVAELALQSSREGRNRECP